MGNATDDEVEGCEPSALDPVSELEQAIIAPMVMNAVTSTSDFIVSIINSQKPLSDTHFNINNRGED